MVPTANLKTYLPGPCNSCLKLRTFSNSPFFSLPSLRVVVRGVCECICLCERESTLVCLEEHIGVPLHVCGGQRTTSASVVTFYLKTGSLRCVFHRHTSVQGLSLSASRLPAGGMLGLQRRRQGFEPLDLCGQLFHPEVPSSHSMSPI